MNPTLERPVVVYVPAYNCERFVVATLEEIPPEIWAFSEVVVVDNCSTDRTVETIQEANRDGRFPRKVHVVRTPQNTGYSGSQKMVYKLVLANPAVQWVVMLHGDGQYPPELLPDMILSTRKDAMVVYGHRDRSEFPKKEETPFIAYVVIRLLSAIESLVTGYPRREWHSGFVMYHRDFLAKVNLDALTTTPHIDGHLLFAAGVLGVRVRGLPIFKRYKGYEAFGGLERLWYIVNVFALLFRFRMEGGDNLILRGTQALPECEVVDGPEAGTADPSASSEAFVTFTGTSP